MAAALAAFALWAVAATALWGHLLAGIPGDYLGQGYPVTPGLHVTHASLAIESAAATFPILIVAALARWRRVRLAALPVVALAWLWAAAMTIQPFAIDFGTTWRMTELFRELFLHPLHTPLALVVVLACAYALLAPRGRAR